MNYLTVFTGFAVVLTSWAMPFDLLGIPYHIDATLILSCPPPAAPVNGRIDCVYGFTNLTCTATCPYGLAADPSSTSMTKVCTFQSQQLGEDLSVPDCRAAPVVPGTGSLGTGGVVTGTVNPGKCIHDLNDCLGIPMGNYPSCTSCQKFVSCSNNGALEMNCPFLTFFDDSTKRCESRSTTCSVI